MPSRQGLSGSPRQYIHETGPQEVRGHLQEYVQVQRQGPEPSLVQHQVGLVKKRKAHRYEHPSDDETLSASSTDSEIDFEDFEPGVKPDQARLEELAQSARQDSHRLHKEKTPSFVREHARRLASVPPQELHQQRIRNMRRLRRLSAQLQDEDKAIFDTLHPDVKDVLRHAGETGSHLAFFDKVLQESGYPQREALVRDLKLGFPITGKVPVEKSAKSRLVQPRTVRQEDIPSGPSQWQRVLQEHQQKARRNDEDVNQEIFRQTLEEQSLGRISDFIENPDVNGPIPTQRFGVHQMSSDGKRKVRTIDDLLRSYVNGTCEIFGRIRMGSVRDMMKYAKSLHKAFPDQDLVIFKSDFKSAYRCVPVSPSNSSLTLILVWDPINQKSRVARQKAMPFGAIAAVYGWDRVGHAVTHVIEYFLKVGITRYVDDIFGVTQRQYASDLRDFILELVTMCGFRLERVKTPMPDVRQTILGINCELKYDVLRNVRRLYLLASVDDVKAEYWSSIISDVINEESLDPDAASVLSGRLSFASSFVAGMAGTSRLRHIYAQSYGFSSSLHPSLRGELQWWLNFLQSKRAFKFALNGEVTKTVTVFTDASGKGGIGAYIILANGQNFFIKNHLGPDFIRLFKRRETNIIVLEAASAVIALHRIKSSILGADVTIFIDNKSALGAFKKGHCRADDINNLMIVMSDVLSPTNCSVRFNYVPSACNIADLPSRGVDLVGVKELQATSSIRYVLDALRMMVSSS